jgi:peptidyl-prolyl cis-trans isomerase SurA
MAGDGHDFEEWVKKYSKGPRADRGGFWDPGEWSTNDEKLQQAILSLNENQVSEPLAGPGGFYLFKVERVVPAHTRTLREVQDDIRERILEEKQQERRKKLLDQLRGRFAVQVLEAE